jgi:hypothetical protein
MAYRFENVLIDAAVPKWLQMPPVERRLARARAAAEDDNIDGVALGECLRHYQAMVNS